VEPHESGGVRILGGQGVEHGIGVDHSAGPISRKFATWTSAVAWSVCTGFS
jgi:hypothetical protein